MLKRGIKDFAYRVYDRELVVLEGDWLNGEYETLSWAFKLMLRVKTLIGKVLGTPDWGTSQTVLWNFFSIFQFRIQYNLLCKNLQAVNLKKNPRNRLTCTPEI